MKALFQLAITAQALAQLVWVGGIIFFAFVAAPLAFHPTIQETTGGTDIPGRVVQLMLDRFTAWETICAGVLILSLLELYRQTRRRRFMSCVVVAVIMAGIMIWYGHIIRPQMQSLAKEIGNFNRADTTSPAHVEFDTLHHRYTRLMGVNLILGLGLFMTTTSLIPSAFRDRDRGRLRSIGI